MSKSKDYKNYHEKKKVMRKDGTVHAGKGKARPHHKDALKGIKKSNDPKTNQHRKKNAQIEYVPRTANKYQTPPKKVDENETHCTYEWLEDNGHKDHVQKHRKRVLKSEDRMPTTLPVPSKTYKDNYNDIFGKKKRGASTGKFKKTKKVYK